MTCSECNGTGYVESVVLFTGEPTVRACPRGCAPASPPPAATASAEPGDVERCFCMSGYTPSGFHAPYCVAARRDLAALRAEVARLTAAMVEGEAAYVGSHLASEILGFLESAGCGKPGTPNTLWAMTQEIIAKRDALEAALAALRGALAGVEWSYRRPEDASQPGECPECGRTRREGHDDACSIGRALASSERGAPPQGGES